MTHTCRAPVGPAGIAGADEVVQQLGCWPCFHDAEVVELTLRRDAESTLTIDCPDPRASGSWVCVVFSLREVAELELADFNCQNVIGQLDVEPVDGQLRLSMRPCFGLSGWIQAHEIRVRVDDDRAQDS
jgi:hypothetical protein